MDNIQKIDDYDSKFSSVRGYLVFSSDISQIIAGGSTAIMLGVLTYFKSMELAGGPFLFGVGPYLVGLIIGIAAFYILEGIQSKSWSAFYDDVLPGHWRNSEGWAKLYRLILNLFLFGLSVACAIGSMSTSYFASEEAGDESVADVVMVDLGALAQSSIDAQKDINTVNADKVKGLRESIAAIEKGIAGKKEEAKQGLGGKMIALSKKKSDQWAKKQISKAQEKAENIERGRIAAIERQIKDIEKDNGRTLRETSAMNTAAINTASAQYSRQQAKVHKKETRNKWIFVIITVGGSIMFIASQTLLGFDRAISGMSYQQQRMYAPDGIIFGWLGGLFDPVYNTRGENQGIKVAKPEVTRVRGKRGRPTTSRSKRASSGGGSYQPKTWFGRAMKAAGVVTQTELDKAAEMVEGKQTAHPLPDQTGNSWKTDRSSKRKKRVLEIYQDILNTNNSLQTGKMPKAKEIETVSGYSNSAVRRYIGELKEEGLI